MVKKIVVVGPESTGKSRLCQNLANHYNTIWVTEYARAFLKKNGPNYTFENLYEIALGQLKNEADAFSKISSTKNYQINNTLFFDTDLQVIKVWSEFVFNKCDNRILTQIAQRQYDLYILCNTEVPWKKDNLREYPDLETRQKLFYYYKETLIEQHTPWVIITSDNFESRLQQAIKAVDAILK